MKVDIRKHIQMAVINALSKELGVSAEGKSLEYFGRGPSDLTFDERRQLTRVLSALKRARAQADLVMFRSRGGLPPAA